LPSATLGKECLEKKISKGFADCRVRLSAKKRRRHGAGDGDGGLPSVNLAGTRQSLYFFLENHLPSVVA
jgi:hypothetical protein